LPPLNTTSFAPLGVSPQMILPPSHEMRTRLDASKLSECDECGKC
ncbi:aspartyl protease, partial [Moesziomyces antarcticus T-34]